MTQIQPLGNYVLIARDKEMAQKGSLFLPIAEKKRTGTVLAIGTGKINKSGIFESMSVAIGDRVLFSTYAGTEFEDENTLLMPQDDIFGILI